MKCKSGNEVNEAGSEATNSVFAKSESVSSGVECDWQEENSKCHLLSSSRG